jgi:hypothetical protein
MDAFIERDYGSLQLSLFIVVVDAVLSFRRPDRFRPGWHRVPAVR